MSAINSILSGVLSPADATAQSPAGQMNGVRKPSSAPSQDVFVPGQWWANQTKAKDSSPATGEESGGATLRQRAAARAYSDQQNSISGESRATGEKKSSVQGNQTEAGEGGRAKRADATGSDAGNAVVAARKADGSSLSQGELQELEQLKTIDTKVRAHEMVHLAVAGSYARGGASFQYSKGPDGKNYAVGGEVPIDVSKGSTPQATISKMQVVRAAALAPADPSPQDHKVAAEATATLNDAQQQLRLEKLAQAKERADNAPPKDATDSTSTGSSSAAAAEVDRQPQSLAEVGKKLRKDLVAKYQGGGAVPAGHGVTVVA